MVLLLVVVVVACWVWWRVVPGVLTSEAVTPLPVAHHDPLGDSLRLRAAALHHIRLERRVDREAPRLIADVEHYLRDHAGPTS